MRSNLACAIGTVLYVSQGGRRNECGLAVSNRRQELAMCRAGAQLIAPSQSGHQEPARAIDARHHGAHWNVEDRGSLRVAELLDRCQV